MARDLQYVRTDRNGTKIYYDILFRLVDWLEGRREKVRMAWSASRV